MNIGTKEHHRPRIGGTAHTALAASAYLFLGGLVLLWAWNTIAAGLFAAPEARYVHALAFLLGLAVLVLPFRRRGRMENSVGKPVPAALE